MESIILCSRKKIYALKISKVFTGPQSYKLFWILGRNCYLLKDRGWNGSYASIYPFICNNFWDWSKNIKLWKQQGPKVPIRWSYRDQNVTLCLLPIYRLIKRTIGTNQIVDENQSTDSNQFHRFLSWRRESESLSFQAQPTEPRFAPGSYQIHWYKSELKFQ